MTVLDYSPHESRQDRTELFTRSHLGKAIVERSGAMREGP